MNSNPEVMPERASTTPPLFVHDAKSKERSVRDGKVRLDDVQAQAAARISEDPMRRTDRYRLVMPWSNRV